MPYENELANPVGFEDVISDPWIVSRLKTFRFGGGGDEKRPSLLDGLKVEYPHKLPHKSEAAALTTAVAIDGSITVLEDKTAAAIKLGVVRKNLGLEKMQGHIVNPAVLRAPFKTTKELALLPGFGVTDSASDGSWDEKFRTELYETMRHMRISGALEPTSLMDTFSELIQPYAENHPLLCRNCSKGEIHFDDDFTRWPCDSCGRPAHKSDYLLPAFIFGSGDHFTNIMVQLERLLMQGIVATAAAGKSPSVDAEGVIFIADGALQLYALPAVSSLILRSFQAITPLPNVTSFVKSGKIYSLLKLDGIEDLILPGMVAMVTDEVRSSFGDARSGGAYGKNFIYRTEDGDKYFVFNSIPREGEAHGLPGDELSDAWSNYPHIATICEYIENSQTSRYGSSQAVLDIIAEANYAASLPSYLSQKLLTALVREQRSEEDAS